MNLLTLLLNLIKLFNKIQQVTKPFSEIIKEPKKIAKIKSLLQ